MFATRIFLLLIAFYTFNRIIEAQQCQSRSLEPGRRCERFCSADSPCRKANRDCRCDGVCGLSCLKKECNSPVQPENGATSLQSRQVGSVVTYTCDSGFTLDGNAERTCTPEQTWNGTDPTCRACPRDESAISRQNRRCMRVCTTNDDCRRDRRCVCDDICGFSCIRTERDHHCPEIVTDARVSVVINPPNRIFTSEATFSCGTGYEPIEGQMMRTRCLGNGEWSASVPTCIPRERCGPPPAVPNAIIVDGRQHYAVNDEVDYRCNIGYYRAGFRTTIRCDRRGGQRSNQWTSPTFDCLPKSCGDPGHLPNGRRIGTSYVFPSRVEYACDVGYRLVGRDTRFCQSNQEWSGRVPECQVVACPCELDAPEHGEKTGSQCQYNDVVSFECDYAYKIEGSQQLRCQADGTWDSQPPTCTLIQCDPPNAPDYGRYDAHLSPLYGRGEVVTFECDYGRTIYGAGQVTCNEHGNWSSPTPRCVEDCRAPSRLSNGRWRYSFSPRGSLPHGTTLYYSCYGGYFECHQIPPVCDDGDWRPSATSICRRALCRAIPTNDEHVSLTYENTDCDHPDYYPVGTRASYSCSRGYEVPTSMQSEIECRSGRGWSERDWRPRCERIPCRREDIGNGEVEYSATPRSSKPVHETTRMFSCFRGYYLNGTASSNCDAGNWTSLPPECIERPCEERIVQDGTWRTIFDKPRTSEDPALRPPGTRVSFDCTTYGYYVPSSRTCQRGSWSGATRPCERIPCEDQDITHGSLSYIPRTTRPTHGTGRTVWCDEGYELNSTASSQCDAGNWTNSLPGCNEKPCEEGSVTNGPWDVDFNRGRTSGDSPRRPHGTVVSFDCTTYGYRTSAQLTCRRGQWRGNRPVCEKIPCVHQTRSNGNVRYNPQTDVPAHGTSRTLFCSGGFEITGGAATSSCDAGNWNSSLPECTEKRCEERDVTNGPWDVDFNRGRTPEDSRRRPHGTVVSFDCTTYGYRTSAQLICRRGQWLGNRPVCERIPCVHQTRSNGSVRYNPQTNVPAHGTSRTLSCSGGFEITGGAATSSCDSGHWNSSLPECTEKGCDTEWLSAGVNRFTIVDMSGRPGIREPGTVATFTCKSGYRLQGNDRTTCSMGAWGDLPTCQRARCTNESLMEGRIQYQFSEHNGGMPRHGDSRTVSCNEGYVMTGSLMHQSFCVNGSWNESLPHCSERGCSHITGFSNDLVVDYYTKDPINGMLPPDTRVYFRCANRLHKIDLLESRLSKCREGNWRKRFPICILVTCNVTHFENTNQTLLKLSSEYDMPVLGDTIETTCAEGYKLVGPANSTCGEDGWEPPLEACRSVTCPDIVVDYGHIVNFNSSGHPIERDSLPGDTLNVTCYPEYELRGSSELFCRRDGQWDRTQPTCVRRRCLRIEAEPAIFLYGRVSSQAASHPENTVVNIICPNSTTHYPSSNRSATCRNGSWEPATPICIPYRTCSAFAQQNGRTVSPNQLSYAHGSEVGFSCVVGKWLDGAPSSTCYNGTWTTAISDCVVRASCPEVDQVEGRTIRYSNPDFPYNQGSTLVVSCEAGTTLGRDTSNCENGAWDPAVATCGINAAVTRPAHMSSTSSGGVAGRAVDNNTATSYYPNRSCIHTEPTQQGRHWWYVDLQATFSVKEIIIYNRDDDANVKQRLLGAKVRVGSHTGSDVVDNDSFKTINSVGTNPIRIKVNRGVEGRYVSIDHSGILNFCEVQVFGEQTGDTCPDGCVVPMENNIRHYADGDLQHEVSAGECLTTGRMYLRCGGSLEFNGSHYYNCVAGEWNTTNPSNRSTTCSFCLNGCVVPYIENGFYRNSRRTVYWTGRCFIPPTTGDPYLYIECNGSLRLYGRHWYSCEDGMFHTGNNGDSLSICAPTGSRICQLPTEAGVLHFITGEYEPALNGHPFHEGDSITSRCQDPTKQRFSGSVERECRRDRWVGNAARCDRPLMTVAVGNTNLQEIASNGTIIVSTTPDSVYISCKSNVRARSRTLYYKPSTAGPWAGWVRKTTDELPGGFEDRLRLNGLSSGNSGSYACFHGNVHLSVQVIFQDIRCTRPTDPGNGYWRHNRADENDSPPGDTYLLRETVTLVCYPGYVGSGSVESTCNYMREWTPPVSAAYCARRTG